MSRSRAIILLDAPAASFSSTCCSRVVSGSQALGAVSSKPETEIAGAFDARGNDPVTVSDEADSSFQDVFAGMFIDGVRCCVHRPAVLQDQMGTGVRIGDIRQDDIRVVDVYDFDRRHLRNH